MILLRTSTYGVCPFYLHYFSPTFCLFCFVDAAEGERKPLSTLISSSFRVPVRTQLVRFFRLTVGPVSVTGRHQKVVHSEDVRVYRPPSLVLYLPTRGVWELIPLL